MGIFDFFRKKKQDGDSPDELPPPIDEKQEASKAALLELGTRLSAGNVQIVAEIKLAIEQPLEYFNTWEDRLINRGIDSPIDDQPWISLVDALAEDQLAFEVDWKEASDTIVWATRKLLDRKQFTVPESVLIEVENEDSLPTNEVLQMLRDNLEKFGVTLAFMDIDSDSYVLITVRSDEIESLQALASKAGYGIVDDFP
ncbi:DUF6630 family protein [Paenibacillus eucommiae]|uniref:DUF6630 domain-containing protein n=1 Tax=Paenibacillus eucommiae TaxID=1355755 RepID=A0ABS4J6N8_9BACL|nr:DUF6630 family protein [Paenibacillus eucommiae]MBP1995526.1 hypothetical protein [Paenibacillus eucommiae]